MPTARIDISHLVRALGVNDRERADRVYELTGCRLSQRTIERIVSGKIHRTARALVWLVEASAKNGDCDEYSTEPYQPINDDA